MAELVDALASGASVRMDVEVRVLFWAPFYEGPSRQRLSLSFFSAIQNILVMCVNAQHSGGLVTQL